MECIEKGSAREGHAEVTERIYPKYTQIATDVKARLQPSQQPVENP